jgi:hypothetical protein
LAVKLRSADGQTVVEVVRSIYPNGRGGEYKSERIRITRCGALVGETRDESKLADFGIDLTDFTED